MCGVHEQKKLKENADIKVQCNPSSVQQIDYTLFNPIIEQSTTNNNTSLAFLLHVSISKRSSSGWCIQRQRSDSSSVQDVRDTHFLSHHYQGHLPSVARNVTDFSAKRHSVTPQNTVFMTLAAVTIPYRSTNTCLCKNDTFPNLHFTVQSNVSTFFIS